MGEPARIDVFAPPGGTVTPSVFAAHRVCNSKRSRLPVGRRNARKATFAGGLSFWIACKRAPTVFMPKHLFTLFIYEL